MQRTHYKELLNWKIEKNRLPLILKGARQTGKTYLLETFAKYEFKNYHLINFEKDRSFNDIFEDNLRPERIIKDLSIKLKKQIDLKNDLIIFDEIQECPKALTSLKYFAEEIPTLAICSAGSLLGIQLNQEAFPVGKVTFHDLFPMTFEEFLMAVGNEIDFKIFNEFSNNLEISPTAHNRLWDILKDYYYVGGMPQAVNTYLETEKCQTNKSIQKIREVHQSLIESYYSDFAKHSGKLNSMHIGAILENIPSQLSSFEDCSTKRFQFKGVIPGKKGYAPIEGPVQWLEKAGLIIKVKICNKSQIPLQAFTSYNLFKLYICDIGLLGAMLNLSYKSLVDQRYGITKGYFAENFVACELKAITKSPLYSWSERTAEIEFLYQVEDKIIPIEVKSGKRTKARSLTSYIKQYTPSLAVKISSNRPTQPEGSIIRNIPLYGIKNKLFHQ